MSTALYTRAEVARRLGWSERRVDQARRATKATDWPPFLGPWKITSLPGSSKKIYQLPDDVLATYIAGLPEEDPR